jgi:hypothetical protein
MSNFNDIIADCLKDAFKGRRARVGVAFESGAALLERLLMEPHFFTVFGDRFHPMFRVMTKGLRIRGASSDHVVFLENRFQAVPLLPRSLDALILLGGLPQCAPSPLLSLVQLRGLLRPGGLLIWPQPVGEGFFNRLARLRYPGKKGRLGAPRRTQLCRLTMEAGFVDIGQRPVNKRTVPWTVTVARAGSRPWELP